MHQGQTCLANHFDERMAPEGSSCTTKIVTNNKEGQMNL